MPDYYEFDVKYAALKLKMKILGDGEGYSLTEFCEEADKYVFAAEMWDKKPYSLSLIDMNDIIKARYVSKRDSEDLPFQLTRFVEVAQHRFLSTFATLFWLFIKCDW